MRNWLAAAPIAAFTLLCLSLAASFASGAEAELGYVSLRVAGANGRHGPGLDQRVDWIYQRAGLPLQVTGQSGPWRRVRDPDGGEVWMHVQNLDARRTFFAPPGREIVLRRAPQASAQAVARLAPGVVGALTGCEGEWRRVSVGGRVGWAKQDALWGGEDCAGL